MALGSSRRQLFRLVFSEGAAMVGVGVGLGLVGAVLMRRAVASQLYNVNALDPLVMMSAVALLGLVALGACALPARRATQVDPMSALNYE